MSHWSIRSFWQFVILNRLLILALHSSPLLRSGQVGVPAGPWEPGNLPESLWPDWALFQLRRRGPVSGPRRRSAAAAVPLPAVWGPDGWLSAIMPATLPPALRLHSHPCSFISLCPLPQLRVTTTLGSLPLFPCHHQRDQFNHSHDYEKYNITGARVCICPVWVKSFSLVSQFAKVSLIILSCAELTSAPEPHLFAEAPASPTRRLPL